MDTTNLERIALSLGTTRTQKDLPVGILRIYFDESENGTPHQVKLVAAVDNWDDAERIAERWSAGTESATCYAVQHDDGYTTQTDYMVHGSTRFTTTRTRGARTSTIQYWAVTTKASWEAPTGIDAI